MIISIFDKNNRFTYKQKVINRMKLYLQIHDDIQKKILNNDSEFLNLQDEHQKKILSLLNTKKRGSHE